MREIVALYADEDGVAVFSDEELEEAAIFCLQCEWCDVDDCLECPCCWDTEQDDELTV